MVPVGQCPDRGGLAKATWLPELMTVSPLQLMAVPSNMRVRSQPFPLAQAASWPQGMETLIGGTTDTLRECFSGIALSLGESPQCGL